MKPEISVRRKGGSVYFKLEGGYSRTTALELLEMMARLVLSQLAYALPDSQVSFTLRTQARVDLGSKAAPARECAGTLAQSREPQPWARLHPAKLKCLLNRDQKTLTCCCR